jgi:ribosome biogenesis SPOUT family RNA methylase Rps3
LSTRTCLGLKELFTVRVCEAAQTDIDFIGGLDPYTIDGAIEITMDFTVQLALDHHKGIDIQLHETGDSGLKTVEYLIDKVNENPLLKEKLILATALFWESWNVKSRKKSQKSLGMPKLV